MSDRDVSELQAILDAMPLMFFQKDRENRIVRANKAAADARGVTVDQLVGAATTDWYPDEAGAYYADDLEVIRSGQPRVGIVEQLQSDGPDKHWIQTDKFPHHGPDGSVDGVLVFIRDATTEGATQESLRRSEAHMRALLDSEPECVKTLAPDGTILEMNPAGLEMIEADTIDDAAAVSVYDLLLPEYHDSFASLHESVRAGASGMMEYEIVGLRGTHRWIETHAGPLVGGDDIFLAVSRDITERKRSERERQSLEAQLRHAQRLEGIGVLAGGVAHDFNNYLMSIMGNAELAMSQLKPGCPASKSLGLVLESARQAADVCDQLLTYAGKRPLERRPTDISALIEQTVDLLRVTISKGTNLVLELSPDLPEVIVDPVQIRQVVLNLVTNASDALGDAPGELRITTGMAAPPASGTGSGVVLAGTGTGAQVFVSVADTGDGMAAELIEQVFEPFFTTKAEGRGLGLATVLGTVRGHGGTIEVQSEPGVGTAITVSLPTTPASDEDVIDLTNDLPPLSASSDPPHPGSILVVDDEDMVRDVIRSSLERSGYVVHEASDGHRALEIVAGGATIDGIVLDMAMPGLDGQQTFARLREMNGGVPVLFSSGYPQQLTTDRDVGPIDFIQKPYSASALVAKLERLLQVAAPRCS